jgi:triacylglycerol lipase
MTLVFNPSVAYEYGAVIEIAYRVFKPGVLDPTVVSGQLPAGWTLVTELTAIDRVAHKTEPEFFGLVVQSAADNSVLIAIRGTDTLLEWLIDAEFTPRAFQGAPSAGLVEDGFASVYATLTCVRTGNDVLSLVKQLPAGTKLTIAGHSLGAAVATLVAVDIAANDPGVDLTLYTYAPPRIGDTAFVTFFDAHVPMNFRIVNRPDIVPHLPPLYDPAGNEIDVDSTAYPVVAHSLACYHTLTTYLWLLDQKSSLGLGTCARADSR